MAQVSQKDRQIRRLKRELKIAMKIAEFALNERDQARAIANALGRALEAQDKEDNESEVDQANRPNEDSAGLEVPTV
jgi:hypothetical protein